MADTNQPDLQSDPREPQRIRLAESRPGAKKTPRWATTTTERTILLRRRICLDRELAAEFLCSTCPRETSTRNKSNRQRVTFSRRTRPAWRQPRPSARPPRPACFPRRPRSNPRPTKVLPDRLARTTRHRLRSSATASALPPPPSSSEAISRTFDRRCFQGARAESGSDRDRSCTRAPFHAQDRGQGYHCSQK